MFINLKFIFPDLTKKKLLEKIIEILINIFAI